MAEHQKPTLPKLREWPILRKHLQGGGRRRVVADGRPLPRLSELLVSNLPGTPSEKLAWLLEQKAAGALIADDPDEIAEAESLLMMLARLHAVQVRKEARRHVDELLDDALAASFPASDPVAVGHFTDTELR